MTITPDTNVLVRIMTDDDPDQVPAARQALADADAVIVTTPTLCELVWVLSRSYRLGSARIADTIRALRSVDNVVIDHAAVDAGLAMLEAGGDFADGAIALEGSRHGDATFLSFDRKAVRLLTAQGRKARLLN